MDNTAKTSKDQFLSRVSRLLKAYQRMKIGEGPGRMTPAKMVKEIKDGARHIVGSLIEKGQIPAGLCDPDDVAVTTTGTGMTVHPPPKLSEWWDKKLLS